MAVTINLLPSELKVSKGVSRTLSVIRMIGVIALAVFIIFGLGIGGFLIVSNLQLRDLNSQNDVLKSQLSALSTTESQFYVLKDRLAKIKTAQSYPSATKNLEDFNQFIVNRQNITINELDILPTKIESTFNFTSNKDVTSLINDLSASDLFKSVTVNSFGFSPANGYTINLNIVTK